VHNEFISLHIVFSKRGHTMLCPFCQTNSKVIETRETGIGMRRRRECLQCSKRFTTYEKLINELIVLKKSGKRELFDVQKIISGMKKACEKRNIPDHVLQDHAEKIRNKLVKNKVIYARSIGAAIMKTLKRLDHVAYIRFTSVYKSFENPKQFTEAIKKL
jgi:transcriptional repressor NrdR